MKSIVPKKPLSDGEMGGPVFEIPVDSIVFNPYQPRTNIEEESFRQLCESIRLYGLMQPVVVRRLGSGYELVAGERRVRAFKALGMKRIPAVVREVDNKEMAILALVENLQRENLNAIEEAEGYLKLMKEFNFTQEQVADYVGKSQSGVANKIRLLRLPEEVKAAISREIINERQARALLRLEDPEEQKRALERIIQEKLNVEQTEKLVDLVRGEKPARGRKKARSRLRAQAFIKDVRIYLNSIKEVVKAMKGSGLDVSLEESDSGEHLEMVIRIAKTTKGREEGVQAKQA